MCLFKIYVYLFEMPNYTEEYMVEHSKEIELHTLIQDYVALRSDIVFPRGTNVVIWKSYEKTLLTIKAKCNYFTVFKNIINFAILAPEASESLIDSICAGYNLLILILDMPAALQNPDILQCIGLATALLLKFARDPFKNPKMVTSMFKICVKLIRFYDENVVSLLLLHNFLHTYVSQDYSLSSFRRKEFMKIGTISEFFVFERFSSSYELLISYLDVIETCIEVFSFIKINSIFRSYIFVFQTGLQLQKIQIPGLIYTVSSVFIKYEDWPYSCLIDKYKITGKCLNIMFLILQRDPNNLKYDIEKHIYNYCKHAFIDSDLVMKNFLKVVRFSNNALDLQMEGESNWLAGNTLPVYRNVKLALSIFLLLSNDQDIYNQTLVRSVFPTEKERRNFLKVLAGYMHQTFDESIAELAVKILKRIAIVRFFSEDL